MISTISSASRETFSTAPSSAAAPYASSTVESLLSPIGDELSDRGAFRDFPFVLRDFERMNLGNTKTADMGPNNPRTYRLNTRSLAKDMRRLPDSHLRRDEPSLRSWCSGSIYRLQLSESFAITDKVPEESWLPSLCNPSECSWSKITKTQ
jgi:hypothetical protein